MTFKSFVNKYKNRINPKLFKPILFVLVFAGIGVAFLAFSSAAINPIVVETENASISGNAELINDSGASGGKAIVFGSKTIDPEPQPTPAPPTQPTGTYDVIIDTDLGGDPDDIQSLVRLCHYSDVLKVKAIISTKPMKTESYDRVDYIKEWIRRCDLNHLRSKGYTNLMTEAQMLATVVRGNQNTNETPGAGKSTAGSNKIIEIANGPANYNRDTNPLWVQIWGTPGTVAQALFDDPSIANKIRIYSIGQFNSIRFEQSTRSRVPLLEHTYMLNFLNNVNNNLWWINNGELPYDESRGTFKGAYTGGNQSGEWDANTFLDRNIRNHGTTRGGLFTQTTGNAFPGAEGPAAIVGGLKEGDSPAMFYLLSPVFGGVGNVDNPLVESWGGQFRRPNAARPNYYVDLTDNTKALASVNKWRVDFLSHWKARWDRY